MKRFMAMLISFVLVISLVSCKSSSNASEMKLKATQLTKEETDVLNLMGYSNNYKIYDYVLNDKVKSIQMNFYTLDKDGKWVDNGGFSGAIESLNGRIAISTFGENGNLKVSHSDGTTWRSNSEVYENIEVITSAISWAEDSEIVCDTEIPIVIQILSNSNEISSYDVSSFRDTTKIKDYYSEDDIVNAITITFSEKAMD